MSNLYSRRTVLKGGVGLASLAGITLLTGCGSNSSSNTTKDEITIWHPYTQPERQAALQKAFDAFTEKTGKKLKIEVVAFADFPKKWPSAQAAGTLPDLAITTPENGMSMWTAGALNPMNSVLEGIGGDSIYVDGLLNRTSKYQDDYFCLPHYVHTRLMHYRTDRLSQAGLAAPETFDDYYEAMKAMTKAPDYYGFIPQLSQKDIGGGYLLWILAQANGSSLFTADGKVTLTDDGVIAAAEWLGKVTKECAPSSAATTPISETFNLLNSGSASMAVTSAAGIAIALQQAPDVAEVLDARLMPKGSAGVGNLIGAVSFTMPKGADEEGVAALVKELLDPSHYTEFLLCLPLFHFPATNDGSENGFYDNETIKKYKAAVDDTLNGIKSGAAPGFENGANPYAGAFFSASRVEVALQDIAFSGTSAKEAMEAAQADLQPKLDQIAKRSN